MIDATVETTRPASCAALAVSVTAVDAAAPGFLAAYPAGMPRPDVSVVNTDRYNTTRANALFVPVTPDGIVVYRSMTTDVIVDLWGWFTGPSAVASTDGLFVPQSPTRVWDSRSSLDPVHAGGTVEKIATPPTAGAVVLNLTAVEPTRPGFMSVFAAGTPLPNVSSLNFRWRQPVAALHHEVRDHPVPQQAVVEALAREVLEVLDGLRSVFVEELEGDGAVGLSPVDVAVVVDGAVVVSAQGHRVREVGEVGEQIGDADLAGRSCGEGKQPHCSFRRLEQRPFRAALERLKQQHTGPLPERIPDDVDLLYAELYAWEPLVDAQRLLGNNGLAGGCSLYMGLALRQLDQAADTP